MSGEIISRGLGKKYKRYPSRWARLKEWLSGGRTIHHEEHWVLRDITFAVKSGEAVGIDPKVISYRQANRWLII